MATALASKDIHEQVAAFFLRNTLKEDLICTMPIEISIHHSITLRLSGDPLYSGIMLGKDIFFQVTSEIENRRSVLTKGGFWSGVPVIGFPHP